MRTSVYLSHRFYCACIAVCFQVFATWRTSWKLFTTIMGQYATVEINKGYILFNLGKCTLASNSRPVAAVLCQLFSALSLMSPYGVLCQLSSQVLRGQHQTRSLWSLFRPAILQISMWSLISSFYPHGIYPWDHQKQHWIVKANCT